MINVAILGAGIGAAHFKAYGALPDLFRVRWLIDKDLSKAASVTGQADTRLSADISDALNDPDVSIVDICLPPHLHVPQTLAALQKGKHVICEKPIATSLADVERIRVDSRKQGKQVFPVFQYRWAPAFTKLRKLVDHGLAGRALVASVETHWSRGADYYAVPWRGTWAGEQGGAVLGHAIHNHDLLTRFMGRVTAVSAFTTTRVNNIETEDCAAISMQFASGALATSSITLGAARDETRLRLVFENLTATSGSEPYAPGSGDWTFVARDPEKQQDIDACCAAAAQEAYGFEGFLTAVSDALTRGGTSAVSLDEGAASIELVTAIYHAARSGESVMLPLSENHPLYQGWAP